MNTREEDMLTSPVHIGLDAKIKLGCSKEGILQAADILYLFDSGAYADKGTDLSKAAAADCTGPYRLEHIFVIHYVYIQITLTLLLFEDLATRNYYLRSSARWTSLLKSRYRSFGV